MAYTQGPGIDAPLMVRAKLGRSTPYDIIPLPNWRGLYEAGVFPDGRTAVEGLDLKQVLWPGKGYGPFFETFADPTEPEPVWLGSLMSHKRDASGQLYMRNRYYDPQSGRFTQEDPIGLAGGLNLYGFGGGDPVNYSDPYGLAAVGDTVKIGVRPLNGVLGKAGGNHAAILVIDDNGNKQLGELLNAGGTNDVDVRVNPSEQDLGRYKWTVLPTGGQTDDEFASNIRRSFNAASKRHHGNGYSFFGQRNSNHFIWEVIVGAGGYIPRDANRPGLTPGLCGGGVLNFLATGILFCK